MLMVFELVCMRPVESEQLCSGHGVRHGGGRGDYGRGNGAAISREQRTHDLSERRRMQCEAANQVSSKSFVAAVR